jgi:hypothetical protein
MDIKELVIKGDNNELWQSINPYKSVCKKIEYVEKNYEKISKKIKTNASKCASIVYEHEKEIAKAIEL